MTSPQSFQRASYICIVEGTQGTHGFYPSFTIRHGDTMTGEIAHSNAMPNVLFDDETQARRAGGEYVDDWVNGWIIQGGYTRRLTNIVYGYSGRVDPAKRASWEAKIYCMGEPRGSIGGALVENDLSGLVLDNIIRSLIEATIESGAGFQV